MRLAFFGDVIGRSGREGLAEHLPGLRRRLGLEFVIVNAENAAAGFGITESTARELFDAGADCLTLGNHAWDQKEALTYIVREPRLIRPLNYPILASAPGRGGGGGSFSRPSPARGCWWSPCWAGCTWTASTTRSPPSTASWRPARSASPATRQWSTCTPRRPRRRWRWAIS